MLQATGPRTRAPKPYALTLPPAGNVPPCKRFKWAWWFPPDPWRTVPRPPARRTHHQQTGVPQSRDDPKSRDTSAEASRGRPPHRLEVRPGRTSQLPVVTPSLRRKEKKKYMNLHSDMEGIISKPELNIDEGNLCFTPRVSPTKKNIYEIALRTWRVSCCNFRNLAR